MYLIYLFYEMLGFLLMYVVASTLIFTLPIYNFVNQDYIHNDIGDQIAHLCLLKLPLITLIWLLWLTGNNIEVCKQKEVLKKK